MLFRWNLPALPQTVIETERSRLLSRHDQEYGSARTKERRRSGRKQRPPILPGGTKKLFPLPEAFDP